MANLELEHSFVDALPGDPDRENRRRQVQEAFYSDVEPTPVSDPRIVAYSREVAELLGVAPEALEDTSSAWASAMSGNQLLPGSRPYAAVYGGHQFGNWAGQLGDGRAITLGERVHDGQRWELQLKGAGPTPFSRMADGRAVMRSSVREFLCSEAMHHLGVPTTRAFTLVSTGDSVVRDMFYDGNARPEPGAVVCRVAPTFLRFGNFEIFAARGDHKNLRLLADHTVRAHFPELLEGDEAPTKDTYIRLIEEVARRTAEMVVHWMRVGFVHGVMNTDNMSILGLTIDYGPYGWLDNYDPTWTPNTTDAVGRRYRYGQQPAVSFWNLCRFAEALFPLIDDEDALRGSVEAYQQTFGARQGRMLADKLGLKELREDEDPGLFEGLFSILPTVETDMTLFFRGLADVPLADEVSDGELLAPLQDVFYAPLAADDRAAFLGWLKAYRGRVQSEGVSDADRRARMNQTNPKYVLRNYLAQLAIDKAEEGDGSLVRELLDVLRHPYNEQPEAEEHAKKRPDWARSRPGCSMLSCSS